MARFSVSGTVQTIRPSGEARYAVLCFFDGNDVEDTKQYLSWQKGNSYYTFVLNTNYMGRYFRAGRTSVPWICCRCSERRPGKARSCIIRSIAIGIRSVAARLQKSSRPHYAPDECDIVRE